MTDKGTELGCVPDLSCVVDKVVVFPHSVQALNYTNPVLPFGIIDFVAAVGYTDIAEELDKASL